MSVQTTITADPPIGLPGHIYDSGVFHDIVSLIASEAIAFGQAVRINGEYCELADDTGEVTGGQMGIAIADPVKVSTTGFVAGDIVPVMKAGRIWIAAETALVAQTSPFVRFTTNGGNVQGGFRNDADTARAVQSTQMRVYRSVAAAGLAVIEITPIP